MRYKTIIIIVLTIATNTLFSCKKFIETEAPKNSLIPSAVFKNDDLAISAMTGIYQQMSSSNYASGGSNSISTTCGLTADEFVGYNATLQPIFMNQILPESNILISLWNSPYKGIYDANTILEGLESASSSVTPPVKMQLQGEAYFVRAFAYFYLVNLFGAVPLQLTTDYPTNINKKRNTEDEVYNQIIKDLKAAELLLSENYITVERVRPNKTAAQALLARIYLYKKDWVSAQKYSSLVIDKTSTYSLVSLDQVFLKNSREAIWQLMPTANSNTPAGLFLILTTVPSGVSLRKDFVSNSFEPNDKRRTTWIKSLVNGGVEYFYPFKYKVKQSTNVSEYSMVFRLAEQYLIRAEAKAEQNNLSGAIEDLDMIRDRAGLILIKNANPDIDKDTLLVAIENERRSELFSEWGHRWFDLKRKNKLTMVLSTVKPGWKSYYDLFPIPVGEINNNTNIVQNPKY